MKHGQGILHCSIVSKPNYIEMYIVRDIESKKILHLNPAPISQELREKDIYGDFDPATMEIGKTDGEIPDQFEINQYGFIEPQDSQEIEEIGAYEIPSDETGYQLDEPFEYLEDGEVVNASIEKVVEKGLMTTSEHCIKALNRLNKIMGHRISLEYNAGYEMKLTKNYLSWLKDGQPENDDREKDFNQMQETIDKIKEDHKELKQKIEERQVEIEKKIKTGGN